ncbi:hypothetical protein GCM10022223_47300 [Kineosporia mesophila]|uniref:Uncharacterized protein n=1 Tax=Kineosporia mesophila TaxID=566012 RepID=A0ABP7A4G0_9ACTN
MINMQIRSEGGEIVTRGSTPGIRWSDALAQIDREKFPCLAGLLPYADTMFNGRQVERLRMEVESQSVRDILGEENASEIETLCRRVENSSHLYLWFLGD